MSVKKRFIINFLSLATMQGLNLVLPLITIPYLLRVVGPSNYGLINIAQSLIQYFILFTDYGFNFVATREISLAKDNQKQLSIIFSSVMFVRILLLSFSLLILFLLVLFIPKFEKESMLYYLTFGMVIGNALFPIWFFQGIEHMKIISILNIFSKLISTLGIFFFVKGSSDYLNVAILNSLGFLSIGFMGLYLVLFRYKVRISKPTKEQIVHHLKAGWDIFISNLATSLYTVGNVFILSFFASNKIVGYYASAERIVKAISSIIAPIIQTVYPYISRTLQESKEKAILVINKIFILITVVMGLLSLIVGLFAKQIVGILGPKYTESIPLIQILSILPLILGWANVFGILTMINFEYKRQLSKIYIFSSIVSIVLMALLIPEFKQYGTAWNTVLTEGCATFLMFLFLSKKKIHIWKWKKNLHRESNI